MCRCLGVGRAGPAPAHRTTFLVDLVSLIPRGHLRCGRRGVLLADRHPRIRHPQNGHMRRTRRPLRPLRFLAAALALTVVAGCGLGPSAPAVPTPTPGVGLPDIEPTGPTEEATVVRVVDGDTIVIDRGAGQERVRYIGIDTPEAVRPSFPVEWMGPEATAANRALVEGRRIILERDVSEVDTFGRLLRYIWVAEPSSPSGWLLVNRELLARGYAQVSTYPPDVKYVELFLAAQRAARDAGVGLWGPTPAERPSP
jgi:endonuclease YncB( thermonuclease family)